MREILTVQALLKAQAVTTVEGFASHLAYVNGTIIFTIQIPARRSSL